MSDVAQLLDAWRVAERAVDAAWRALGEATFPTEIEAADADLTRAQAEEAEAQAAFQYFHGHNRFTPLRQPTRPSGA
jgi:hypothetical protein